LNEPAEELFALKASLFMDVLVPLWFKRPFQMLKGKDLPRRHEGTKKGKENLTRMAHWPA
jgi:hypothetical protein